LVDLSVLQPVSWFAAAIGVCVAAFYYALNLRETTRNRRATFANSVLHDFLSEEGALRWVDILSMKWDDFDDYVKKYDSSVNRENFAKRIAFWNTCEAIGYQYRTGAIDLETIYNVGGIWIMSCWLKFKPIIERYREWEWPKDASSNWEYLANALEKMQKEKDADYKRKSNVMISTHVDGINH
jgi:hypothetical protein